MVTSLGAHSHNRAAHTHTVHKHEKSNRLLIELRGYLLCKADPAAATKH
jgi:hypothetical protein